MKQGNEQQEDDAESYEGDPSMHITDDDDGSGASSDDDDATETWLPMVQPNVPRTDCGLVAWKRDYLIIVGGKSIETRQCVDSVELYDFASSTMIDNGGGGGSSSTKWRNLPPLNVARRHCAVCIVQDRYLYVLGGNSNVNGSFVDLDSVERLDLDRPVAFDLLENLPVPIRNATPFVWEDQIYLIGGYSSFLECSVAIGHNTNSNGGYLPSIVQYHGNPSDGESKVVAQLPAVRRLPAVFVLPQHRKLVLCGGYHPTAGWTTDGCTFNLDDWSRNDDVVFAVPKLPVPTNSAGGGDNNAIFAYWTIGNQCHVIVNRTYCMWEYGSPKWQSESADHIRGTRGLAVPNAIVAYDNAGNEAYGWWNLDRPTTLGSLTIDAIADQISTCQLILHRATTAGFWELQLLDEAAAAAVRLPKLQRVMEMLESVHQLERHKQSLVDQFATLQQRLQFQQCRALAWSIRDVENDLEQAYDNLWSAEQAANSNDLADDDVPQQQIRRRRSSVRLGGQLKRLESQSGHRRRPLRQPQHVNLATQQQSVSSMGDEFLLALGVESPQKKSASQFKTPASRRRRKSSLLLKGLLSYRDLKEIALSSDQSTTGGVY
jgi:hypothetical protein